MNTQFMALCEEDLMQIEGGFTIFGASVPAFISGALAGAAVGATVGGVPGLIAGAVVGAGVTYLYDHI